MHILVVEDKPRLAHLLHRVLMDERHNVDVAYDGVSGLDLASSGTYDLVLLDLMLPKLGGIEVCQQMRADDVKTPVLMLTARSEIEDRVLGLNAGADDYLIKPFAVEELVARVNALLRRRHHEFDTTQQLQVADLTLNIALHQVQRAGHTLELTLKEFALLEYLMRHPGQVLTRSQLIDHVWRYDSEALSNVVDIYIHYLRDKIDLGFSRSLIKTVRGLGYKIEP